MPNDIENTLSIPSSDPVAAAGAQPAVTASEDREDENTLSNTASAENTSLTPNELEKLRVENERLRSGQSTLQRKLDRLSRQRENYGGNQPQYAEEDIANWAQHPMSQEMLIKAAEVELKEGVGELLKDYSNIPEPVKRAITANPRGWVHAGTVYVEDALSDIEDFLSSFSDGDSAVAPQGAAVPKPKEFPVAATNGGNATAAITNSGDPKADAILELFSKGKSGLDEAFRRLSDGEVDQKTFDKAIALAEKSGVSVN